MLKKLKKEEHKIKARINFKHKNSLLKILHDFKKRYLSMNTKRMSLNQCKL